MILTLFFLMLAEERNRLTTEESVNSFIIACSYIGTRGIFNGGNKLYTNYGACMNPAIAIGITIASLISDGTSSFKYIWLYPLLPFAGSLLAFVFYEFVYKKTVNIVYLMNYTDDELMIPEYK